MLFSRRALTLLLLASSLRFLLALPFLLVGTVLALLGNALLRMGLWFMGETL